MPIFKVTIKVRISIQQTFREQIYFIDTLHQSDAEDEAVRLWKESLTTSPKVAPFLELVVDQLVVRKL